LIEYSFDQETIAQPNRTFTRLPELHFGKAILPSASFWLPKSAAGRVHRDELDSRRAQATCIDTIDARVSGLLRPI
jgi:hypothetical protein